MTASSLAASAATTNTQGLLVGSGTKLIYAVANLGPGGYSDVSQAGDSGLFAEPGTGSGANGFVIGLHAGGASTAALRIAPDGSVNASGALTGKSFNGVGLGASAVVGLYQDSTNSAVRTPGGNFYVQNAGGVKTALIAGPTAVANGPGLHVIGQLVVDDVIHVPTAIRGGNGAGNLHIDSNENAGGDGHIYLDYYSGTGVIFGAANGSGRVGSVDTAGNAGFNGTVTAGNFSGPLNGLQIWVKGGDNGTASCQNYCANVLSWPDAHGSGTCIGESNANLADGTYYSCGAAPGISVRCICAR